MQVPICCPVGGLQDTISDHPNGRAQTGFLSDAANLEAYTKTIQRALGQYQDASSWQTIQKRAMRQDFSWDKSAKKYIRLYRSLTGK
jgi:starch synthase